MSWRLRSAAVLLISGLAIGSGADGMAYSLSHRSAQVAARGPLSGSWSGYIGSGSSRQSMKITINAQETRGTWQISARCRGTLTLDSISGGYHHFRRHAATAASCAGGDVDRLKRAGAQLYDAVTSHLGGAWDTSGTFKRVRV